MNRQEIITLAESLGLLYPEPKSSSDYNHPAHMRLISKLEKFAEALAFKPMSEERKQDIVSNYFSDDWAQSHAIMMLEDYEKSCSES